MTKTPKFAQALEVYFSQLVLDTYGGQWRTCRISGKPFYVRGEDVSFYRENNVPLPTISPNERARRKFAFSNSFNLFKTTSALSGKPMISQFPEGVSFPVYDHSEWRSDAWDAGAFGRPYLTGQSFFSQIKNLMEVVPRPSLNQEGAMVNSEYCHNSGNLKNCYLSFNSNDAGDCSYAAVSYAKNSLDVFAGVNCDTCYDGLEVYDSWKCFYSEYIKNCQESYFLYDCRNCSDCFGGVNLRNRKYVFFNEQLTKEEYETRMQSINLGDAQVVAELSARFLELKKTALHKPTHDERASDSVGNYIRNSAHCYMCFYPYECENLAYSVGVFRTRDSYDIVGGMGNERSYESFLGTENYGIKFSFDVSGSRDLEYCQLMSNSRDCFGSVGLKNKSFCIFNTQYTEEEYWSLVDEIKTAMLAAGEYGEFFPGTLSPVPYEISEAMSFLGYDNYEEAVGYGYRGERVPQVVEGGDSIGVSISELPSDIRSIGDDILEKTLIDLSGKRFRIVPSELAFYRTYSVPLPRYHYSTRIQEKRKKLGSIALTFYDRMCRKCGVAIKTVYPPADTRIVYCEDCYSKAVA